MSNQASTLSVRAILDSGEYARGARAVAESNKEMAASGKEVAVVISQTESKLSGTGSGISRLGRAYDQAGTAQAKFATDIKALNTSLEGGKTTAEKATAVYVGMVQKLGMVADGAHLIGQGYASLGGIIETTNQKLRQTAMVAEEMANAASMTSLWSQKATALKAQLDPVGTSLARLNSELADHVTMLNLGELTTEQFGHAQEMATSKHQKFAASVIAANETLMDSYKRMAAAAREEQGQDNARSRFDQFIGVDRPVTTKASDSASVFEEQLRQQDEQARLQQQQQQEEARRQQLQQQEALRQQQEYAQLRAQQNGGNFASDLNASLGVTGTASSARASAAVFEEAAREAEMYTQQAAALKAALDPVGASQARLNAELELYGTLLNRTDIDLQHFTQAEAAARQRHEQFVASLEKNPPGGFDNNAQFRRQNLGYQAFDIGQGLTAGLPLGMIAAQQGPQIAQAYMGQQGGAMAAVKTDLLAVKTAALAAAAAIPGIGWAFIGVTAAATAFYFLTRKETKTTDEVLKEHATNINALGDAYGIAEDKIKRFSDTDRAIAAAKLRLGEDDLAQKQKDAASALAMKFGHGDIFSLEALTSEKVPYRANREYSAFQIPLDMMHKGAIAADEFRKEVVQIGEANGLQKQADKIIAAIDPLNTLNNAAQKTYDIFAKISGLPAFAPKAPSAVAEDMGAYHAYQAAQEIAVKRNQQALDAQLAEASAKSPQEKANAAKQTAAAQYQLDELPSDRARRIELAGNQALLLSEIELRKAKEDRIRTSAASLEAAKNELTLTGKTVEEQNRLRAAYQAKASLEEEAARRNGAADPTEVANAQKNAADLADINAKVALGKLTQDQGNQAELLQREISLIGQSVQYRNQEIAALQARQQLLQQGISLLSDEAKQYIANAKAIAEMNAQISLGKLVQDQGFAGQQLQLEADLIGASVDQRARAAAALQAEIQLKQQGIDTNSEMARSYIAIAEAQAHSKVEIDRQNAAYQSLQQAQGSVIDDLVTGTGTMKDRLKAAADDVLKWFQEVAVANPLKNALTGTNLPTLADLFSGKPKVPGASAPSTATMTVTAAVVNVNGGVPAFPTSGVPRATTTLTDYLKGKVPALNAGVTPNNLPSGINPRVPSLFGEAANQNIPPTSMIAYQNAIKSIESNGGDYGIMGPVLKSGDRAYGAYQVMGNNIPSWSEKYTGQRMTPTQFLADPKAQDTVFNGEFGGYVDKYGPSGAASKWFTGSATPTGKKDILGTTDNQYVNKFNSALKRADSNLASTSKQVSTLGENSADTGKSLLDSLGSNSSLTKAVTPVAAPQAVIPQQTPTTGGFNPLSLLTSFFGLFGFADGTDYAPGGWAMVGERGPEIVNLPRGSRVVPNHKLNAANGNGGGSVTHKHEYNITVSGNGDKGLMENMRAATEEAVRAGITHYDQNSLPKRMQQISEDQYASG